MNAAIQNGGALPQCSRKHVRAERQARPLMRGRHRASDIRRQCTLVTRRQECGSVQLRMLTQVCEASLIGDARMIGAQEQLALAARDQLFGDVLLRAEASAPRVRVQLSEPERGDIEEDAHHAKRPVRVDFSGSEN